MSNTTRGRSFKDALYDQIEAKLEREYGLPSGGMRAIRTKGERSNSDQVSPVGARTVYQIMPATRRLFRDRYGVDAYASPEQAARVAALHLRDSMQRNGGSWAEAVGEYHGGPDRSKWGNVNRAYRERVLGPGGEMPEGFTPTPVPTVKVPTADELLHGNPLEGIGETEDALRAAKMTKPKVSKVDDIVRGALSGGDGSLATTPLDMSRHMGTDNARMATAVAEQASLDSITTWDRVGAAWDETLTQNLIDVFDGQTREFDQDYMKRYTDNWQKIEAFAQDDREVDQLRETTSDADLTWAQNDILERRERDKAINSAWSPTGLRLGMGIIDPVGWAAGFGVGKGVQALGVGSRALAIEGRALASIASASGEGALGNLAVTAGLDAAGEDMHWSDYLMNGLSGLAIGGLIGGATNWTSRDAIAIAQVDAAAKSRASLEQGYRDAARAELGPDALTDEVESVVRQRKNQDLQDHLAYALADIPEDQRLLIGEEILTQSETTRAAAAGEEANLGSIADRVTRRMAEEARARSERIVAANPIDEKALQTVLSKPGWESDSTRMLLSKDPVMRAVGITLLENPQGAAGRHRTAAIGRTIRERVYNQQVASVETLANQYRKQGRVGMFRDFLTGKSRNDFNRRVFGELERRGWDSYAPDAHPLVVQAANLYERGFDLMRNEQQFVGAVGSARLGDNSRGYVPHRLDPRKVLSLTPGQQERIRQVLAGQFIEFNDDIFGDAFADKLATKYLANALEKAKGQHQAPMNISSPEAGEMVRDALQMLGVAGDDLEKAMGKFSRGGASHTKKRLRLDLDADIGDGMKLMDLFVTDVGSLFRSYARRVSGEVALAQYGVMGKKGADVLRTAMTQATPHELHAYDRVVSELLNIQFGEGGKRHPWMDDLRVATSAARLGGMGITQLAEFGNAVPSLGIVGAIKGVASMGRHMKAVRELAHGGNFRDPVLGSLDDLGGGLGMEGYHMTRMFDVPDASVEIYSGASVGLFSRALRAGAHANMVLSGQRLIMASQTRSMAEQIIRKAVKYAKDGTADAALDDMGIHGALRTALRKDLDRVATFDAKGNLLELDLFAGKALTPAMVNEMAQAVERGAGQIIQRTFTGETGVWAHDEFLKVLTQFRTFSLTSVEKQWGRQSRIGKMQGGALGAARPFLALMGAASFALPIHLARLQSKMVLMGDAERKEYWEENANPLALTRAVLNYASASGLAGDTLDIGAGFAFGYSDDLRDKFGDDFGIRGKGLQGGQAIGGVFAPSVGLVNDTVSAIIAGRPERALRSLPGSNLPYVAPFVTAALETAREARED